MGTITLEGLEFFAYHGFFKEERKIGNKFSVDLTIEVDFSEAAQHDKLSATIDYGKLYEIVEKIMQKPAKLLEHLAQNIVLTVKTQYPQIKSVEVSVAKHNPPVGGVCKWAKIRLKG